MLGNAVSGVKLMVSLQLLSRVFTFVLNALVLRQVSSEVFGAAAQLQAVSNLVLFFSREGVRRACARGAPSSLARMCLLFGVFSGALVGALWLKAASRAELAIEHFQAAVLLVLAAAMIELLGETAYTQNVAALRYRARFFIESAAVLAMCATLFVGVTFFSLGLMSWGLGQVAFALVNTVGNVVAAGRKPPQTSQQQESVGIWLLVAFQWQATQQVILQEGERLLLKVTSSSLADQGLYAVVTNLGSLLVRSLFLPLEDVAGTYFSRLLLSKNNREAEKEAASVLRIVLHLLSLISLLLVALGPPLSFFGLDLLYGSRISDSAAPSILKAYCFYVSLLGLNGVTEAFVRAAITPAQQYRLNLLMIVFSVIHVVSSTLLLKSSLASVGLVYANCLGMMLRLCYSIWFIRGFFPDFSWRKILPPPLVVGLLLVARLGLSFSSEFLCSTTALRAWHASLPAPSCWLLAIAAGIICCMVAVLEYLLDRTWLLELRDLWKGKSLGVKKQE